MKLNITKLYFKKKYLKWIILNFAIGNLIFNLRYNKDNKRIDRMKLKTECIF